MEFEFGSVFKTLIICATIVLVVSGLFKFIIINNQENTKLEALKSPYERCIENCLNQVGTSLEEKVCVEEFCIRLLK